MKPQWARRLRRRCGPLDSLGTLAETVLEAARQSAHVAHPAGALGAAALSLGGPVVCKRFTPASKGKDERGGRGAHRRPTTHSGATAAVCDWRCIAQTTQRPPAEHTQHMHAQHTTYSGASWRRGSRMTSTSTSGCGTSGDRTAGKSCATCCGACQSYRYPCLPCPVRTNTRVSHATPRCVRRAARGGEHTPRATSGSPTARARIAPSVPSSPAPQRGTAAHAAAQSQDATSQRNDNAPWLLLCALRRTDVEQVLLLVQARRDAPGLWMAPFRRAVKHFSDAEHVELHHHTSPWMCMRVLK